MGDKTMKQTYIFSKKRQVIGFIAIGMMVLGGFLLTSWAEALMDWQTLGYLGSGFAFSGLGLLMFAFFGSKKILGTNDGVEG